MKKSIYDYFTYSIYKYAPESFRLFFKDKEIYLNHEQKGTLSQAFYKGKKESLQELKKVVRKNSTFANNTNVFKTLAIRTNEGENTYIKISNGFGYGRVNIFDIGQKLMVFKDIKKAYNNNNFNVKVTTGKMNIYGKMDVGEEQEIQKPMLLNRIIYV